MKKKIILICFYISFFTASFSQEHGVELFIKDEKQKPIENVYVLIAGKPITVSDKVGSIKLLNHGLIHLQHLSYESKDIDTKNAINNVITMTTRIHHLEEINILPSSTFKRIFTECIKRVDENYPVGNLQYFKVNHYSTSEKEIVTALDGQLKINVKSHKDFNYNNDVFIDEHTQLKRTYFENLLNVIISFHRPKYSIIWILLVSIF